MDPTGSSIQEEADERAYEALRKVDAIIAANMFRNHLKAHSHHSKEERAARTIQRVARGFLGRKVRNCCCTRFVCLTHVSAVCSADVRAV